MRTVLLWDWNGTLLDDTSCCAAALDAMLRRRGLPERGLEFFRENFAFPAKNFYSLVGIDVSPDVWDDLAREYHREYLARPATLAADARAALDDAAAAGAVQCILSALRQDLLEEAVATHGLRGRFARLAGSDSLDGAGKTSVARALAATLAAEYPGATLALIGDSLHDAEVAREIGARCVLYGGGSHAPHRLAEAAPVAATLREAVALALVRTR